MACAACGKQQQQLLQQHCFTARQRPCRRLVLSASNQQQQPTWHQGLAAGVAAVALALVTSSDPAWAAGRKPPPITESSDRCSVESLDKFADTRARFSQEASGGNMTEAIVDIRGCDFSNMDLSSKVGLPRLLCMG